MLAKNQRAPRAFRKPALSLTSIASVLAPTVQRGPCRSEQAREEPESTVGIQETRVIVDVHRERARSYSSTRSL